MKVKCSLEFPLKFTPSKLAGLTKLTFYKYNHDIITNIAAVVTT